MATVEEAIRRGGSEKSVVMSKAMLLHAAFLKHAPINDALLNYQGIGAVPMLDEVLFCDQYAPTIVFDANFQDRPQLCKRSFPLPASAINGKNAQCEILMTLYYDPPLDGSCGLEYVRSNVEAKLGVRDPESGEFQNCVLPHITFANPHRFKIYEKQLVTSGFKWSPLKLYYADLYLDPSNGLAELPWELQMRVFRRAEYRHVTEQQAFLFITIRSKNSDSLLYDEWIRQMDLNAWETKDLAIDQRVRVTPLA